MAKATGVGVVVERGRRAALEGGGWMALPNLTLRKSKRRKHSIFALIFIIWLPLILYCRIKFPCGINFLSKELYYFL